MSDALTPALSATLALADAAEPSAAVLAVVGVVLLATGAALLPLAGYLGTRVVPERRVFFARWGGRHFALVFLSALLALLAAALLVPLFGAEDDLLLQLGATLAIQAVPAAVAWRCARATEPDAVASFGLQRAQSGVAVLYGLGLYLLFLPAIYGAGMLWPWCLEALGETPEAQAVLVNFADVHGARLVVALLLATLVVPFLEEFLFRGFLQPFLVQNFHDRGGVVLTAFFFALLHGTSAFLPIFVLGLLLGAVALKTRRLYASWAIHAVHNGSMLFLFLRYPDLASPSGGWLGALLS